MPPRLPTSALLLLFLACGPAPEGPDAPNPEQLEPDQGIALNLPWPRESDDDPTAFYIGTWAQPFPEAALIASAGQPELRVPLGFGELLEYCGVHQAAQPTWMIHMVGTLRPPVCPGRLRFGVVLGYVRIAWVLPPLPAGD